MTSAWPMRGDHVWHGYRWAWCLMDGLTGDQGCRPETVVELQPGDTYVVPKGIEHRPSSPGSSILMFEPSGTSSTGDRHEGDIPDHVDSTTGHEL